MNQIKFPVLVFILLFVSCTVQASMIIFEDEFTSDTLGSTWAVGWTVGSTPAVGYITGDYFNSPINTSGNSDHSGVHFDADGNEIAATGDGYLAIGTGNRAPVNSILTNINVTAGNTYMVYFRHTGAPGSNQQNVTGTMSLGADSATTGVIASANNSWASASFAFTPTTSGSATLRFDDTGTNSFSNDLLLDSVVVANTIPEPSAVVMFCLGAVLLYRRLRLR